MTSRGLKRDRLGSLEEVDWLGRSLRGSIDPLSQTESVEGGVRPDGSQAPVISNIPPLIPLEGLVVKEHQQRPGPLIMENGRKKTSIAEIKMIATTECHEEYEKIPHHFTKENDLAPLSHLYSLIPLVTDENLAWTLFRGGLLDEDDDFEISDLPSVEVKIMKPKKRRSSYVIIQCRKTSIHEKLEEEICRMETEDQDSRKKYRFRWQDSGPRLSPEVFVAEFAPADKAVNRLGAIDHLTACRVATQFAKSCGASPIADYSDAKNGVLGLWRSQRHEITRGRLIESDLNEWTIGLTLPGTVDRTKLLAYFTDMYSGTKFRFIFVGRSKYCKDCKDNSIHENESDCPKTKDQGGSGINWSSRFYEDIK